MTPEESLSYRVARGGAWVFALRMTEKNLGMVRLVIFGDMKTMVTAEKYNTGYYDPRDYQREELIKREKDER